jgi:hypothetical protein
MAAEITLQTLIKFWSSGNPQGKDRITSLEDFRSALTQVMLFHPGLTKLEFQTFKCRAEAASTISPDFSLQVPLSMLIGGQSCIGRLEFLASWSNGAPRPFRQAASRLLRELRQLSSNDSEIPPALLIPLKTSLSSEAIQALVDFVT